DAIPGIASMKNEDLVQEMCRHFGVSDCFDQQLGIDLVGTMTKADLLTKGFRALGLKPSECVLIGDTDFDSKGAQDAHCDCIKVNWGFGYKKEDPGTISSPAEILDLV
ncbi:MAG: HAD hydrolase-like protein, partial [Spirochaetales bacterium]|nr:HAD hydrolase-like protein [Spirochaetales bacterium]